MNAVHLFCVPIFLQSKYTFHDLYKSGEINACRHKKLFFRNNLLPVGKRELVAVFNKNLNKTIALLTHTQTPEKVTCPWTTLHYKYIGSRFLGGKIKRFQSQNLQTNKKKEKKTNKQKTSNNTRICSRSLKTLFEMSRRRYEYTGFGKAALFSSLFF